MTSVKGLWSLLYESYKELVINMRLVAFQDKLVVLIYCIYGTR